MRGIMIGDTHATNRIGYNNHHTFNRGIGSHLWLRNEMDIMRLGIDVTHDFIFEVEKAETTSNTAEVNTWDNAKV